MKVWSVRIIQDWSLEDAEANLSRVVDNAVKDGPQRIVGDGRSAVVVISEREFERLVEGKRGSLMDFLAHSPLKGLVIPERDHCDAGTRDGARVIGPIEKT